MRTDRGGRRKSWEESVFVGTDYSAGTALTVQKPVSLNGRKKTVQTEFEDR
jgi:hypothetical protein